MAATPEERRQFGDRLKMWRLERGHTQDQLAEAINAIEESAYSRQSVSQWEIGRNVPPRTVVAAIEKVLGVEGELAPMLGYGPTATMDERVSSLEAQLREIREIVEELARRSPRRRQGGKGAGA